MPRNIPHRRSSRASKPVRGFSKRSRPLFEALEARHMLAAQDLLVGLYDGGGTIRYNEAAGAPAAGAVAPGDNGLEAVAGEAV
ncbi:MAG TPA: hypothetical protein VMF30_17480, partial [Pirellulales bacterium]|nr:hypothetical protein [Pirellulales bacterium]